MSEGGESKYVVGNLLKNIELSSLNILQIQKKMYWTCLKVSLARVLDGF